jgi:hypothetical protein
LKAESPKRFLCELGLEETQFKAEFYPSLTRRRQQIVANYLVKYRGGKDIFAQKWYVYENHVLCSSWEEGNLNERHFDTKSMFDKTCGTTAKFKGNLRKVPQEYII